MARTDLKKGVDSTAVRAATRSVSAAVAKPAPSARYALSQQRQRRGILRGIAIERVHDQRIRRIVELVVRCDGARRGQQRGAFRAGERA